MRYLNPRDLQDHQAEASVFGAIGTSLRADSTVGCCS